MGVLTNPFLFFLRDFFFFLFLSLIPSKMGGKPSGQKFCFSIRPGPQSGHMSVMVYRTTVRRHLDTYFHNSYISVYYFIFYINNPREITGTTDFSPLFGSPIHQNHGSLSISIAPVDPFSDTPQLQFTRNPLSNQD